MLQRLVIVIIFGLILLKCKDSSVDNVPERISKLIRYFENNRMKTFDTLNFQKAVNAGANFWRVADSTYVSYTYSIGFPSQVNSNYNFPVADSVERIQVFNTSAFARSFPMTIDLPEQNLELILDKKGLMHIKKFWFNNDYDKQNDFLIENLNVENVFKTVDPFKYFRSKSEAMDSLGIYGITRQQFGNVITISLSAREGYLDYLPNDLFVRGRYRKIFDSVISKGTRINNNWVRRSSEKWELW